MMLPRPPTRLTPPSTTAATELSRKEVFAAGSAAPTRATSRIAANPGQGTGDDVDGHLDAHRCRTPVACGGLGRSAGGQHVGAEPGAEVRRRGRSTATTTAMMNE